MEGKAVLLEGFPPKKKKELQAEIGARGGKIVFMINKEVLISSPKYFLLFLNFSPGCFLLC